FPQFGSARQNCNDSRNTAYIFITPSQNPHLLVTSRFLSISAKSTGLSLRTTLGMALKLLASWSLRFRKGSNESNDGKGSDKSGRETHVGEFEFRKLY